MKEKIKKYLKEIQTAIKQRKVLSFFIALVVIAIIFFVKNTFFSSKKPQYQTAKVESGSIVSTISSSGQIASSNFIQIQTQVTGKVTNVYVKDGDTVSQGQKIADITPDQQSQQKSTQAWSSYLLAKTNLDQAQSNLYSLQSTMFTKWKVFLDLATSSTYQNADGTPNEINRVLPQFHIAQDDWLAGEANYKNQQAVVAQSQTAASSTWLSYQLVSPAITAPMAGTISNLNIVSGLLLSSQSSSSSTSTAVPSQKIATIKSEGLPIAAFNISEVDISKIKIGQKATVVLDALPGKTFVGEIATIDKTGVVSSGVTNYPILIQFETEASDILPNMSATANIIVDSKDNVLTVPESAVQTVNNQSIVRVLKNGTVQSIPVETGLSSDSAIEIISGLSDGDTIVIGTVGAGTQAPTGGSSSSPFSPFRGGNFGGGGLAPGGRGR